MITSPGRLAVVVCLALAPVLRAGPPDTPQAGAPAAPESVSGALVPNYTRLTPALAAAGQPAPEAIPKLRALGFKTIVNLRPDSEPGVAGEADAARAQGLDYVSVPITAESFDLAAVVAVQRVLDDPARAPVLLHCSSANRVGGVWAVIQARAQGLDADAAVVEGRKAGLHSQPMIDAVKRVLEAAPAPAEPRPQARSVPPVARRWRSQ